MLRAISCGALAWALALGAMACPTDTEPRAKGVLLTVQGAGAGPLSLDAADLAKLPITSLTQRQVVTSSASAASDRITSTRACCCATSWPVPVSAQRPTALHASASWRRWPPTATARSSVGANCSTPALASKRSSSSPWTAGPWMPPPVRWRFVRWPISDQAPDTSATFARSWCGDDSACSSRVGHRRLLARERYLATSAQRRS